MMVHKQSLGVLESVSVSPDDPAKPMRMVAATPENLARYGFTLDLDEWWFVPNGSTLATKIRRCYPDFTPCVGAQGDLVNIVDRRLQRYHEERQRQKEEADRRLAERRKESARRGYRRPLSKTPVQPQSMGFLHDTLQACIKKKGG